MNKVEELRNEIYKIMDKKHRQLDVTSMLDIEMLVSRIFEEDIEIKNKYDGSIKKYCEEELNL